MIGTTQLRGMHTVPHLVKTATKVDIRELLVNTTVLITKELLQDTLTTLVAVADPSMQVISTLKIIAVTKVYYEKFGFMLNVFSRARCLLC